MLIPLLGLMISTVVTIDERLLDTKKWSIKDPFTIAECEYVNRLSVGNCTRLSQHSRSRF